MFRTLKTASVVLALSAVALTASAATGERQVPLSHGGTLHIYPNGKMAMENQYGHVVQLQEGQTVQAQDGSSITTHGNEEARLSFEQHLNQHR